MKFQKKDDSLLLQVKVVPNSSRNQIAGMLGDALKIKVAQPPEDGKANRAVEELLAEVLGIPKTNVAVVAGHTRPQKTVRLVAITSDEVVAKIGVALR